MINILIVYLVIINLITFFIMFADKSRAVKGKWRIPEKTIFFLSFIGGSLGSFIGMHIFRHKTRHFSFRVLLPLFLALNVVVLFWLLTGDLL